MTRSNIEFRRSGSPLRVECNTRRDVSGASRHADEPPRRITTPDEWRVLVVALREAPNGDLSRVLDVLFREALGDHEGRALVFLPGVQSITRGDLTAIVENLATRWNNHVVFEASTPTGARFYRYFHATRGLMPRCIGQLFANSTEANNDPALVKQLLRKCRPDGERTLAVGSFSVGLLVCGENNVLRNAQTRGNAVEVRHGLAEELFDHADIIFNGAHSVMGNWGKLDRRFEFLSADRRLALYATNNTCHSWRASVRAYFNGALVADGEGVRDDSRLQLTLLRDSADRYRALAIGLPSGRLP